MSGPIRDFLSVIKKKGFIVSLRGHRGPVKKACRWNGMVEVVCPPPAWGSINGKGANDPAQACRAWPEAGLRSSHIMAR